MTKYPYGIASYPQTFKGTVVSPTKICLQFANPECMLRLLGNDSTMLPRGGHTHQPYLTLSEDMLQLEVLAVGCQMPVLFDALKQIVVALDEYAKHYQGTYRDTYGKPLRDDCKRFKQDITDVINKYWPEK